MFINNNSRIIIYAYEKYYPQVFLEEFKYMQEKIITKNYIDEELNQNLILITIVILILMLKINHILIIITNFFNIINADSIC